MSRPDTLHCPLCNAAQSSLFHTDAHRTYWRCAICMLIFVPPNFFLSPEDEKAEYDLHENSPADTGYRRFLSRLFAPLQDQLTMPSHGLDFGAGPGPTLSVMFEEAGHRMDIYDRFYAPDETVFSHQYDFVTATEVVEHLHQPQIELTRLWRCLKPGGWLGIMTKLALDQAAFAKWHYIHDRTHVCFWSRSTFQWLATQWQAELTFLGKDVMLLQK